MISEHFPESFYRVSVKGLLVLDEKLLMVKESTELSGKWELPGGGLDFGERPHDGIKREIEEEMNLKVSSISEQPTYAWTSKFEYTRNIDWYYSLVLGYKIQLNNLNFTPTAECEEIGFFSKQELHSLDLHHQSFELRKIFNPLDFD